MTRPSIAVIHIVGSSILVMRVELPAVLLELAHTKIITIVLVAAPTRVKPWPAGLASRGKLVL